MKVIYTNLFVLTMLIMLSGCLYPPEIKTVNDFTETQVNEIQSEFGFTLPEKASIIQAELSTSMDKLFTIVISGINDVEGFIEYNLDYEVGEQYQRGHFSYDEDSTDWDKRITVDYYTGDYDGNLMGIYVYQIDDEMIVEIDKEGIVSQELVDMFYP